MNKWTEIEDTFLTNQRRGSDEEPTEYYVLGYECVRQKRGIRRKRLVETLKGADSDDLDGKLAELVGRPDSICIGDQSQEYVRYRGEPKPLPHL